MSKTLTETAQALKDINKKVQLIYAFNGTGKTRLSREFKQLIAPKTSGGDDAQYVLPRTKILYYNALTEDLFYWDNDLTHDIEPKLKIQPNFFTEWVLQEQGQDQNVIANFQRYTDSKLTPKFSEDFSEVTFSFRRGNDEPESNIKISKGEESNFVWSVFYTLLEQVIAVLNVAEPSERETNQFDPLGYVFIDDPVSSLDENHLIELAVDLAELIKSSQSDVRFMISTHNPLFYNVLSNEFNRRKDVSFQKYILEKNEDGSYDLKQSSTDSPFSYHLYLKSEIEKAVELGRLEKYHFNFFRNILEKSATFLGYARWEDLLPNNTEGERKAYVKRMLNLLSHSKHAGEEIATIKDEDKRVLTYLLTQLNETYHFQSKKN
ncbi:MAG: AAA family ATPase [Burkholderiales bacterium]|nr:AAA family ATPase [Burkholderiales bacterium]